MELTWPLSIQELHAVDGFLDAFPRRPVFSCALFVSSAFPSRSKDWCKEREPGGYCDQTPTGQGNCTWTYEDAGEITIDARLHDKLGVSAIGYRLGF